MKEAHLVADDHDIERRDETRLAQLIELSQGRVYRLAMRITRNTEDAEDVQQETMLKVQRKFEQFEGRSRFTTWISRIAINEALMFLRKRRRAVLLPLEEAMPPEEETLAVDNFQSGIEGPEAAYSRKELWGLLMHGIESLGPANRVVFLLRAIEQLSITETAKALQISASSVKARMRRARIELRRYLWGYLHNARTVGTPEQGTARPPASDGQLTPGRVADSILGQGRGHQLSSQRSGNKKTSPRALARTGEGAQLQCGYTETIQSPHPQPWSSAARR